MGSETWEFEKVDLRRIYYKCTTSKYSNKYKHEKGYLKLRSADPLFKDVEKRDFTLAENSPAIEAGFEPWEYNAGTITER